VADRILDIADGFWNVRGSFKKAGFIELGTQTSLVRLQSGRFVLLDAYTLSGTVEQRIRALTNDLADIEAVIHLHPFHTIHVERVAEQVPHAKQYGTDRHVAKAPNVDWAPERTDTEAFAALYADDFTFTVPRGVDFVPDNENLHFASVLALHRASRTLHVDDTLTWAPIPIVGGLMLHPTLGSVLQKRAGAAAEFQAWCDELVALCADVDHLCTAHMRTLPPTDGASVQDRVRKAIERVRGTVEAHAKRHG